MAGATLNCCHLGACSVGTIHPCTSLQCYFMQLTTGRVHVCLAVTCHLHFWQNDRDLLCAIAVTWRWNGDWNTSQHRKLTPEKKILLLFLRGFEPGTFQTWLCRSITELFPLPYNTAESNLTELITCTHQLKGTLRTGWCNIASVSTNTVCFTDTNQTKTAVLRWETSGDVN